MTPEFSRRVALDTIGAGGHKTGIAADAGECAALATRFGWTRIESLSATANLLARAGGVDALGTLNAVIERACVASGDPVRESVEEAFAIHFLRKQTEAADVDESEFWVPLGVARTAREGTDVTVVAISSSVPEAVAAAEELAKEGVSVEVIDPRTLVPLDRNAILRSVAKTGRLVVAEPAHRTCGAAAEISALVAEEIFDSLRAPIIRVTAPDMQIPFSPSLEKQMYPTKTSIAAAIRRVVNLPALEPVAAAV